MFGHRKKYVKNGTIPIYKSAVSFTYAMVFIIVAYVVAAVIKIAFNPAESDLVFYASGFFLISLALFFASLFTVKKNALDVKDVTKFKFHPKFIAVILLTLFGTLFGFSKLNDYFVAFLQTFGYVPNVITLPEKSVASVIVCVVFIAVIPAVTEEFLFRGLLLKSSEYFGKVFAVIVSATAFSLYHMSPAQTIYQFVLGVIYGFIALSSESVLPTIILHFLNNFTVIVLNYFFPTFNPEFNVEIILAVLGVLSVVCALMITLYKFDFSKPKCAEKEEKIDYAILVLPGFFICAVMWIAQLFV